MQQDSPVLCSESRSSHITLICFLPPVLFCRPPSPCPHFDAVMFKFFLFTVIISDTEEGDWYNLPSQSSMKPPNWGNSQIP